MAGEVLEAMGLMVDLEVIMIPVQVLVMAAQGGCMEVREAMVVVVVTILMAGRGRKLNF